MYDHVLIILAQMRSKTSSCSGETLSSPWLTIPLEDYEAHMALPAVGQAQMLVIGDDEEGMRLFKAGDAKPKG